MRTIATLIICLLTIILSFTIVSAQDSATIWAEHSTYKVGIDELPPSSTYVWDGRSITVKAARNETEPFQLVVRASDNANLSNINVQVNLPGIESEIYLQHYVEVTKPSGNYEDGRFWIHDNPQFNTQADWDARLGFYPDALIPLGVPFDVPSGQNQPSLIILKTSADTRAGQFDGTVSVYSGDTLLSELPLRLIVWDFALPDEPVFHYRFWGVEPFLETEELNEEQTVQRLREMYAWMKQRDLEVFEFYPAPEVEIDDGLLTEVYFDESDAMLAHLIELGYDNLLIPIPEELEDALDLYAVYMEKEEIDPDEMAQLQSMLAIYLEIAINHYAEMDWLDHMLFFVIDEPGSVESHEQIRYWGEFAHNINPDLRVFVTAPPLPENPAWGSLDGVVDVWSFEMRFYEDFEMPFTSDELRADVQRVRANGESVAWYGALMMPPGPSLSIDQDAIAVRIIPWMSHAYDMDTHDYWSISAWWANNPWEDPMTWPDPLDYDDYYNGEGSLTYPGWQVQQFTGQPNAGVVVPSIRLELLRQGQEDYTYLYLLGQSGGDPSLYVDQLIMSLLKWEPDPLRLLAVREQIAYDILMLNGVDTTGLTFTTVSPPSEAYLNMPETDVELCTMQYVNDPDCTGSDEDIEWCRVYYQLLCETGEEPSEDEVDAALGY